MGTLIIKQKQIVNNISIICKGHVFIWQSRKITATNVFYYLP